MSEKSTQENEEVNLIRNRFTAYLSSAIHNRRIDYLYKGKKAAIQTLPLEEAPPLLMTMQEADIYAALERRDVLYRSLKQITDRERYVLFAHVLEEKDFGQIGKELGLSYKGAASVYYRAISRMRRQIGGDPDGF